MLKRRTNALGCFVMAVVGFSRIGDTLWAETGIIQDNSFLIEEAYNQERGIIQHIQTFQAMKGGDWSYSFTQEWPVPDQTHQLSYTIPVSHLMESSHRTGIGDVAINYRYELRNRDRMAIAPRLSALLPTGSHKEGMGSGAAGVQTNLPVSWELSDRWVSHWNGGVTFTPDNREPGGAKADTWNFNYGASLIWLLEKNWNMMLELAGTSIQDVREDASTARRYTFLVNPGMRFAFNFKSGLQIVPGFSVPIGIGPSAGTYSVFTYLSFEHPLF